MTSQQYADPNGELSPVRQRFQAIRERAIQDSASSDIRLTWERISPERAESYLARNTRNRPLRQSYVTNLSAAMQRGEWKQTGDPIKFSVDGRLIDGQHRLHAVIQSKTTVTMAVARGVPDEAFPVLDIGAKRRLADVLSFNGAQNTRNLATVLKLLWLFEHYGRFKTPYGANPSYLQLIQLHEQIGDIEESIQVGRKTNEHLAGARVSLMAALHYVFSGTDSEKADTFFAKLGKGINLTEDDPVLRLRERILDSRRGIGKSLTPDELGALTIKAWNAFLTGRSVRQLSWRASGPTAERYPVVEGRGSKS